MAAGRFPQNPAASCTSSRTSGVTLLHKRVENSRSKQGCHSEMTARPAAVLPHKNHAHSLHSAGIFGIPSEFVAPGNASEARAAPSPGSGRCRAPPGPRELPQARSGTATRQLPAASLPQNPGESRSSQPRLKTPEMQNHLRRLPREPRRGAEDLGPKCNRKLGQFGVGSMTGTSCHPPNAARPPILILLLLPEH